MNVSPTPKRYNPRAHFRRDLYEPHGPIDGYARRKYEKSAFADLPPTEKLVPEEIRAHSQALNDLLEENKRLKASLLQKQDEIGRLNGAIQIFRQKLDKYVRMNGDLKESLLRERQRNDVTLADGITKRGISGSSEKHDDLQDTEMQSHYSSKEAKEFPETSESSATTAEQVKLLRQLVDILQKQNKPLANSASPSNNNSSFAEDEHRSLNSSSGLETPSQKKNTNINKPYLAQLVDILKSLNPTEEDILCRETMEYRALEEQVEQLNRRLLARKVNEQRKAALNLELQDLMKKLDMNENDKSPGGPSISAHDNCCCQKEHRGPRVCSHKESRFGPRDYDDRNQNDENENDLQDTSSFIDRLREADDLSRTASKLETPTPLKRNDNIKWPR